MPGTLALSVMLLPLLLLFGCATASSPSRAVAPEAPREQVRAAAPARAVSTATRDEHVEIESVRVLRASEAPDLLRRMNLDITRSRGTLLLDVRTASSLGDLQRGASPVIVLDGVPLNDTYPIDDRRLVAQIPERQLRDDSTIVVTWLGAETNTTSRRPFPLRVE